MMKYLILLGVFCQLSVALDVAPIAKDEESDLVYASYNLPRVMSIARMERLLQQMADVTYQVGFRFIGDAMDFDHGHLLYEQREVDGVKRLFPRAILYHTQEHAYSVRWRGEGDAKYDYLEVTNRNWIQWLDGDPRLDGRGCFDLICKFLLHVVRGRVLL